MSAAIPVHIFIKDCYFLVIVPPSGYKHGIFLNNQSWSLTIERLSQLVNIGSLHPCLPYLEWKMVNSVYEIFVEQITVFVLLDTCIK